MSARVDVSSLSIHSIQEVIQILVNFFGWRLSDPTNEQIQYMGSNVLSLCVFNYGSGTEMGQGPVLWWVPT